MNTAKQIISSLILLTTVLFSTVAHSETLVYRFTMRVSVPRVYNNTKSMGYRKAQWQIIKGYIKVDKRACFEDGDTEPDISSYDFINNTHKINGKKVTYSDYPQSENVMWRYIGNNKTGVFKNTCVKFDLDLNPSYNIGDDDPDNTILIQLSGIGSSEKSIKGSVTGQIGCGCSEYGHISPTRDICGNVVDITPLYGNFSMHLKKRIP